jgi:mRNA interferase MazF
MTTTQSLMQCNPGDVVLVPFKFADNDQVKARPAVIVSAPAFHTSRADAVMLALTTQKGRNYFGDCSIVDWKTAGLPKESTAKGVIRTIERSLIQNRLGSLTANDLQRVQNSLRAILDL